MDGRGKSDRPVVPGKLPNKGNGTPLPAEEVEGRGLTKGNLLQRNRFRTQCRGMGRVWTTLNGHEAGNRGHSQGPAPTLSPMTCKARCSGYDRQPARIRGCGSLRSGITFTT